MPAPALGEISPMLALERPVPPFTNPDWVFEPKYDGFRCLAQFGGTAARLQSRKGTDMSSWFPELTAILAALGGSRCVVDGEISLLNEDGIAGDAEFRRLTARAARRGRKAVDEPVTFCVFDVLVVGNRNVMPKPLLERKRHLQVLFAGVPHVRIVDHVPEQGVALFRAAVKLQLEGLMAKRSASPYQMGQRSGDWLKLKRPGAVPAERFRHRGT